MASEEASEKPDVQVPETVTASIYRPRKSLHDLSGAWKSLEVSVSLVNRGLLNPTGENNCFLNSVVQILWNIDVFRRSFRDIKGHSCIGKSCIFCALKSLFAEFQHGTESAIPPDVLRGAMAACYEEQHRFQLGLMDDAAECFEKILEQVHFHLTGDDDLESCVKPFCLPHVKFSLTILERTECVCGATSEPLSFMQFVHYVSAPAIVAQAKRISEVPHEGSVNFGKILNAASCFGENKPCPNFSMCKRMVAIKRILLNCPDCVCLGLIWDSDRPSVEDLMSVVNTIGLSLQLTDVFDHVFVDSAQFNQYELTATVAYYGRHYSTFCFHSRLQEWIYFDDAKHRVIGPEWSDVVDQIRRGHYQPLLLVYTNPFADPVDTTEAPVEILLVEHCQRAVQSPDAEDSDDTNTVREEGSVIDSTQSVSLPQEAVRMPSIQENAPPGNNNSTTNLSNATNSTITNTSLPVSSTKQPQQTIDPLTLSVVPPLTSTRAGNNSVSTNRPRPSSKSPTTAVATQERKTTEEDLMMFSISPAIAGGSGTSANRAMQPPLPLVATPHNRQSMSPSSDDSNEHADLIQFSISPWQIANIQSQYSRTPALNVPLSPTHSSPTPTSPTPTSPIPRSPTPTSPIHIAPANAWHPSSRPVQTRPAHTGPAHTGSSRTGPAHSGPAHTGPAHTRLTHSKPTHTGPRHTGPAPRGTSAIVNRPVAYHPSEMRKLNSGTGQAQRHMSEVASTSDQNKPSGESVVQYSVGDWNVLSLREQKKEVNQPTTAVTVASRDDVMKLQESTRTALSQARDIWAKIEALRGSDDVVALTLCTQYNGLLLKALQDPAVAGMPALKEQISAKRTEGYQMLEVLRTKAHTTSQTSSVFGECVQCGRKRQLKHSLCGPCQLRAKINYPT